MARHEAASSPLRLRPAQRALLRAEAAAAQQQLREEVTLLVGSGFDAALDEEENGDPRRATGTRAAHMRLAGERRVGWGGRLWAGLHCSHALKHGRRRSDHCQLQADCGRQHP